MSRTRSLKYPPTNRDAPINTVVVDISGASQDAPGDGKFRALNVSVAGLIYLTDLAGTTAPEYVNTGWNPCTVCKTIVKHASNTATILKAALDAGDIAGA
jgi:hypothetical protein